MGNLQQHCRGISPPNQLVLDHPDGFYSHDEKISGRVRYPKHSNTAILIVGTICFEKGQRKRREKCQIRFFSEEFPLIPIDDEEERFEINLDQQLPPSFNEQKHCPHLCYSLNLISKQSPEHILSSKPIRICPQVTIDRPLLLAPVFFGPVENHHSGMRIEIKVNRGVYNFGDLIEMFYELQNPQEIYIHRIEISLGIYYLINSQVSQEDICKGIEVYHHRTSETKLIRSKALLAIPKRIYLPPTFKFQYAREGDRASFNLTIDYKIQFRIYVRDAESVWQVDVPIVLAHKTVESTENEQITSEVPAEEPSENSPLTNSSE